MFCLSEGKCVSAGSCNNQDRSLWTDKNGYGIESSADGFNRQQYYCPSLNAYVTNKKACQIMTKLSSNVETENVEEVRFSCGRGMVCDKNHNMQTVMFGDIFSALPQFLLFPVRK